MRAWLVVLLAAAGTYAMRASLIVALSRVAIPPGLAGVFRYVAPAAMAALAVPAFAAPAGTLALSAPHAAAGVAAGAVAWRWRSLPATLAAGLGAFWLASLAT